MTQARTVHDSFTLERFYPASAARLFQAFADQEAKARWFGGPPGFQYLERAFDFRVDGQEIAVGRHAGGDVSGFYATYLDIVPDRRIVYNYRMTWNGVPISASLACVEMVSEGGGARLKVTEHGIFLDSYEDAGSRAHGTAWLLDQLGQSLL